MYRRNDCNIGSEITVFAYRYFSIILTGEIEIDKCVFSYLGVYAVMKCNRSLKHNIFI